jgi:hypothetical protein
MTKNPLFLIHQSFGFRSKWRKSFPSEIKTNSFHLPIQAEARVARFFMLQHTKTGKIYQSGKNTPKREKYTKMTIQYSKWP